MDKFMRELASGEINIRDKWQFELKSEFFPAKGAAHSIYKQEFYFFIPNSLQINKETYGKNDFYSDQTNFIRYKTPVFSFAALNDPNNSRSPLARVKKLLSQQQVEPHLVEEELKLLGNIVRSALRRETQKIVFRLEHAASHSLESVDQEIIAFCGEIEQFRLQFDQLKELSPPESHFNYLDKFISSTLCHYLTGLLFKMRDSGDQLQEADRGVCTLLIGEQEKLKEDADEDSEMTFYQRGLLNKFVLDALLLNTSRSSPDSRFKNLIASFAAGIAMLVFLLLFVWQGHVFIINSEPFILATVVLYILKDRLKEGLKALSVQQAFKWFSDYTTKILSPDGKEKLGILRESFSIVESVDLPQEIVEVRNKEFHELLEEFPRPETIIYHKKTIEMLPWAPPDKARRQGLNIIYRFNILRFLRKADNASQSYMTLDPSSCNFLRRTLPKVYHLNIILKNSYTTKEGQPKVELKKFRVILDKNGIKRIEHPS